MRLIDADAIVFTHVIARSIDDGHNWNELCVTKDEIDDMPTTETGRKKGKWIEVYGYATPGGDPVWKCSECGKGMHVYGIEAPSYNRDYADGQWVACPNCGAIMEDI